MNTLFSRSHRSLWQFFFLLVVGAIIAGCSSDPTSTAGVGTGGTGSVAKVDVTDAPGSNFAHVYVTVAGVAFHADAHAPFLNGSSGIANGWQLFSLPTPKTIDLVQLSNGVTYSDINGGSALFDGLNLPAGTYTQIRIFLVSTEDAYVGTEPGLIYNNDVQLNGDASHYPLRVPSSIEGIKIVPEYPVTKINGNDVNVTLDFKLGDDVVEVSPNGSTEFILKPRLGYFDMGRVGAVKGKVNFSNLSTSAIEVKAEQIGSDPNYRVVRRTAAINKTTGKFNLYPLPVFGNATTAVYDILLRGNNIQTAIIKGVKIHSGTTKTTATDLGTITMQSGNEFSAQISSAIHPTGAWLNFYQTIAGDAVPYEIRYRHLNPYTGRFGAAIGLSTGPIQVATFSPGSSPVFSTDASNQGTFSMVADAADLYTRGAPITNISGTSGQNVLLTMLSAHYPQLSSGASPGTINCVFDMALLGTGRGPGMGMGNTSTGNPPKGQLFITSGGVIIDSIGSVNNDPSVGAALHSGGGISHPVAVTNLPSNVSDAVYGVYALGWGNGILIGGNSLGIDLSAVGSTTVTIKMK